MPRVVRDSLENKLVFHCPGCGYGHFVRVNAPDHPNWDWNNSYEKPTFTPSILVNGSKGMVNHGTCHSYVTDGRIQFLGDCWHSLAGQTVDLPLCDEIGDPAKE